MPGGLPGHVGGEEGLEDDGGKSTDNRECYQDEGSLVVVAETMPLQTNLLQQQQQQTHTELSYHHLVLINDELFYFPLILSSNFPVLIICHL